MADDTDTIMKMLEILRAEAGTAGVAGDPFDNLKTEYETAKRNAKSAEDWERYQTAFAKALPEFTSGIISADAAFKSGDAFGGAAAIMDICATTANFIGGLSAAGGPPGAVVGAIFSMVSMILNAFKPQAPPLTAEIENLLRTIQAEGRIDDLKTVRQDWEVFSNAVNDATLKQIPAILRLMNPVEGTCFHLIRYATLWLQNEKNYSQDLWTEILVTQCQFYIDVMLSCTLINQRIMSLCASGAAGVPYRRDPAYADALEAIDVFMLVVNKSHPIQMQFLNDIRPLARNKGLVFHIGAASGTVKSLPGPLYLQTVPKGAKTNGNIEGFGGIMDAISVSAVRRAKGDSSLKPRLAAFHTSTRDPWPWVEMGIDVLDQGAHNYWSQVSGEKMTDWNRDRMEFDDRRNHPFDKQGRRRYGMSGNWELSKHSDWKPVVERTEGNLAYDIWATPGDLEGQIYLYSASGNRIDHTGATVTPSGFDYNYGFTWNDMPNGYKVGRVRSPSRLSPPFHDEDPAALKDVSKVIYGLCEVSAGKSDIVVTNGWKNADHMEIRAYYYNKSRQLVITNGTSFLAPWRDIRGIGVDSRYLWVFRVAEIACATHTSVKECLDNKDNNLAAPSWNTYKIPARTIIDPKDGKVYDGLLDLAPCDDGTLTAAVGLWYGPVYTMAPRIDRKARSIEIDKWLPFDDVLKNPNGASKAFRVHKQPVGGWSIVEGLMEALEKTSTTLKIDEESVLGGTNTQGTITLPLPAAKDITVTFTTNNKEAIPAPDSVTIKTGKSSCRVSIKTQPRAKDEVAAISAVLSTSFTTFQPLELAATLKTVPVTFTVDRSVTGGQNANGEIALSNPAADDIAVTFEITGGKKIFDKPDPITIKKGTKSATVFIKTSKVAANANALITATGVTGLDPSQPFEDAKLAAPPPLFVLDAKLTAIPPTMKLKAESS
jgi:hypothetical protein